VSRFLGLDGARAGWIVIGIDDDDSVSHTLVRNIDDAHALLQQAESALIDMPIGIADAGPDERRADPAARKLLGKRSSSVFPMPCRIALSKSIYLEASAANFEVCGRKLSKQTWNIMPKIAEVDVYVREHSDTCLRESHPEVCFTGLNGGVSMTHSKKTFEGHQERLRLLKRHYRKSLSTFTGLRRAHPKKDLADDDILDALVLAVTARLGRRQKLKTLPEQRQYDGLGLPMEIVYPG
jgi:predicted RNase H-like nuclease